MGYEIKDITDIEFLKEMGIPPVVKKDESYLQQDIRLSEQTAEEDIFHTITPKIILELEQMLLDQSNNVTISIQKYLIEGHFLYSYLYQQFATVEDEDDYHHSFTTNVSNTRKGALLLFLLEYKHVYGERVKNIIEGKNYE